ncbi:MAG: histone deacetylase [Acidimicrobiales bacterium]|nr:histone deacetylase [Acidimicrobiales bacterium]
MLALVTDERCAAHVAGTNHPERPDRLHAAIDGVARSGVLDAVESFAPRAATVDELALVHDQALIDHVHAVAGRGGGRLDPDTVMNEASLDAALLAAGSVVTAVETLGADERFTAGFCVVRPPGHHATAHQSMGFCLFNSVAVAAATRVSAGERVAIVDFDAHHGNGTQDIFYRSPDVLFASVHQHPLYPGSGMLEERGDGAGLGHTINLPLPPGATGDVVRTGFDEVITPAIEAFAPDWLFVSAGFDGHRADPITDLGYASGDIADFVTELQQLAPARRAVVLLEGGYDLDAIRDCSAATAAALVGESTRPEPATSGGPGADVVELARQLHQGQR